ncbi:MAG TPA: OsmC family protein [Usitatibacteraceae bacterium]|nr:OsmC family protein [Usitatibacteraceae bacterium]
MSTHTARLAWRRGDAAFTDGRYSRAHAWSFDGGATVSASSSPHVVPLPYSDASAVDPEEAFVAALASCHMLFFLSFAARRRFVVDAYEDEAEGVMEPDADGRPWVSRVTLRPRIAFSGDRLPTPQELDALHHEAHEACFLARSVRTEVRVEPAPSGRAPSAGSRPVR